MSEAELFAVIQQVNEQYGSLFAEIITINFAMIVAIWYFLHRARLAFKAAAFAFYAIGMLALIGMMLTQANYKSQALNALRAIPEGKRSAFGSAILDVQDSWLAIFTSVLMNGSLWVLAAVVAWPLFFWKGDLGEKE